ncbi:unnamed protein product [Sphagnum troendelagicum]|uniref:Uncharacterized protein n=1 Tax=Sphagnum troendelagicum TaxID=128251 RepID=A0ABP0U685_9BRYO
MKLKFSNLAKLQILQSDNNQLNGSLPQQLANVVSLHEVLMGGNSLCGPIPSTFGTQMVYLENSNLSPNLLSGSIPPSICSLKMLQILDVHGNSLNQSLPLNPTQLMALEILSLSSNQFSSSIPAGMGDTVNPMSVYSDRNQTSGCVPAEVGLL